jgi:hypothetical protein
MLERIFGGNKESAATCEVCGNQYDKAFEVRMGGKTHVFDSFECAIHALAPTCDHCGCRIIGHGVEADGVFYCCAHCAEQHGTRGVQDRETPEREQSKA